MSTILANPITAAVTNVRGEQKVWKNPLFPIGSDVLAKLHEKPENINTVLGVLDRSQILANLVLGASDYEGHRVVTLLHSVVDQINDLWILNDLYIAIGNNRYGEEWEIGMLTHIENQRNTISEARITLFRTQGIPMELGNIWTLW